jgi:hypothetical protein
MQIQCGNEREQDCASETIPNVCVCFCACHVSPLPVQAQSDLGQPAFAAKPVLLADEATPLSAFQGSIDHPPKN